MTTSKHWLMAAVAQTPHNATALTSTAASDLAVSASVSATDFDWSNYFQAIAIMLFLLALLWIAVWALRRYGKLNFIPTPGAFPKNALRLEAQLPLGPKKGLMVVRFLNSRLLLGVTDQQITFLKEVDLHGDAEEKDESGNEWDEPLARKAGRDHAGQPLDLREQGLLFEGILAAARKTANPEKDTTRLPSDPPPTKN